MAGTDCSVDAESSAPRWPTPLDWPTSLPPPQSRDLPRATLQWLRDEMPHEQWRQPFLRHEPHGLVLMASWRVARDLETLRASWTYCVKLWPGVLGPEVMAQLLAAHQAEAGAVATRPDWPPTRTARSIDPVAQRIGVGGNLIRGGCRTSPCWVNRWVESISSARGLNRDDANSARVAITNRGKSIPLGPVKLPLSITPLARHNPTHTWVRDASRRGDAHARPTSAGRVSPGRRQATH